MNTKKQVSILNVAQLPTAAFQSLENIVLHAVVCLSCAAHTNEGKERPPATELPLSVIPLRFPGWQVPLLVLG